MIPDLLAPLTTSIAHAADPEFPLEALAPTGNPAFGDYQWNFAFRLADPAFQLPLKLVNRGQQRGN